MNEDSINEIWTSIHRTVPQSINAVVHVDKDARGRIESNLKVFSQIVLRFGLIEHEAEAKANLETIVTKSDYSLKDTSMMTDNCIIKAKFLNRRILNRFESYEEYCTQRAFWNKK